MLQKATLVRSETPDFGNFRSSTLRIIYNSSRDALERENGGVCESDPGLITGAGCQHHSNSLIQFIVDRNHLWLVGASLDDSRLAISDAMAEVLGHPGTHSLQFRIAY